MQALSYMRRNSTYNKILTPLLWFVLAIVYANISSFWIYATPLIGVAFYYVITHIDDEKEYFKIALIFLYSVYIEIDRSLIPFSFFLFVILFYKNFFEVFKKNIYCQNCLIVIYVVIGYLGYYGFNLFLSYLFDLTLPKFGINYLYYMLSDIALIMVF